MKHWFKWIMMVSLLLCCGRVFSATWYVSAGSATDGPGTDWGNAFHTVEQGVEVALDDDTVWVAAGTYILSAEVAVTNNILIQGVGGADSTVVDGGGAVRCFNLGERACQLEGFTLLNGLADGGSESDRSGGAVYCADQTPRLVDCIIESCEADCGGAIYMGSLSNCTIRGNTAEFGGGLFRCSAVDCVVSNNTVSYNGGGVFGGDLLRTVVVDNSATYAGGGIHSCYALTECSIIDNSAGRDGGGADNCCLSRCALSGNEARRGGGIADCSADSCLIKGNQSEGGGGAYCVDGNELRNCTIVDNDALKDLDLFETRDGGGVLCEEGSTLLNCIIWGNLSTLVSSANYDMQGGTTSYCCTTPALTGTGNTSSNPQFAGGDNYRLTNVSPCRNSGFNESWMVGASDLDGEKRNRNLVVDMGAYEFHESMIVIEAPADGVEYWGEVEMITVSGTSLGAVGTITCSNAANSVTHSLATTNSWRFEHFPLEIGTNQITVMGTDLLGLPIADRIEVVRLFEHGPNSPIHYVALDGAAVYPYSSRLNAATNIQDALDVASDGDTVMVDDGIYDTGGWITEGVSSRVSITKHIVVESVNGPDQTVISGSGPCGPNAVRGVYLSAGTLSGFTVTNGHTWAEGGSPDVDCVGGGVWIGSNGTVTNCTLSGNGAVAAGGAYLSEGGTLADCMVADNISSNEAGGVWIGSGATVTNCTLSGNESVTAGGVYLSEGGTLVDCMVADNIASNEAGGVRCEGGELFSCVIEKNSALNGGGVWVSDASSPLRNCLIAGNSAVDAAGGLYVSTNASSVSVENCTISDNSCDDIAGGVQLWSGTLRNCIIYGNTATNGSNEWSVGNSSPVIEYTCTMPASGLPGGVGCISDDPLFYNPTDGDYRLLYTSTCIDVGSNQGWMADAQDLDGKSRIVGISDMGCYEYRRETRYVSNTGGHQPPFESWVDAASDIQTVIDASYPEDIVVIASGTYIVDSAISIDKKLTVRSASGDPELVVVDAQDLCRVFELTNEEIVLTGLTVTNGNATSMQHGGGIYCGGMGPVISNCVVSSSYGNYGGGVYRGNIKNCLLHKNRANNHGGGACSAIIEDCDVIDNYANRGGGVALSTTRRSWIKNNEVRNWGGGVYQGTTYSSVICGNIANYGGGIFEAEANNCTILFNHADSGGGGTSYNSVANNSIIFYNTAVYEDDNIEEGTYHYCCIPAAEATGTGTITDEPGLLSYSHLAADSSCIGAGSSDYAGDADIDGEAWSASPSIGCDERYAASLDGALSVDIEADDTTTYVGWDVEFISDIRGQVASNLWTFGDGTEASNQFCVNHAWSAEGSYTVTLTAFNSDYSDGISRRYQIQVEPNTYYVAQGSANPTSPYSSWETAAHSIEDAVDVALDGGLGTILVSNGVYVLQDTVVVDKHLTIKSVNGKEHTILDGNNAGYRCLTLNHASSELEGFTLRNGHSSSGGAVFCNSQSPVISHCIITGSSAENEGGGVYQGTLKYCVISHNTADEYGGGLRESVAYDCLLIGNSAEYGGGAADVDLVACTVVDNSATNFGGGVYDSDLINCVVWSNTAGDGGQDVYSGSASHSCASSCVTEGSNGCITADPLFVDAVSSNYHLRADSPCIDVADDRSAGYRDLDGIDRPLDGNNDGSAAQDMGCYECIHAAADTDGDTMTDQWELNHQLDPINPSDQSENPDADCMDNQSEFIADTDPQDPTDWWKISNDGEAVSFNSSSNRLYLLWSRTNLVEGSWGQAQPARMGVGGPDTMSGTNSVSAEFFRLEVQLP